MDLDVLDLERGGDYFVREQGQVVVLPSAADLNWKQTAAAIVDPHLFATAIWPAEVPLTAWKLDLVHEGWIRHNGLTDGRDTQHLVMLMQRYFDGIEYDLQGRLGVDAGELWRQRRWRKLLGYITSLPGDTRMNYLLSQDEEYLEQALRNGRDSSAPSGPSMAEFSLTNAYLAKLIDAVNRNTEVTKAAAGGKPGQVKPEQRPLTAVDRIRNRMARQEHEEMAALLLRNRPDRSGGKMNGSPSPAE